MPLNLEDKKSIVAEVHAVASKAFSAVAAEYRGLSVSEMTELRSKARNSGVYLRVVKNTLARRAVDGTEFECMKDGMVGPLVLAFSKEDPSSAARLIKDFAKGHDKMVVKVGSFGGKVLSPQELDKLATMPTRDQALSMLMAVMKAPVAKLARTIAAVRDQKQATA
ncbi:MAG: large subunit ribosomal protein [Pseudomonadota bacterium]|nr:large subunit ribosomal protein [Pseudomonadota bacterium]